MDAAVKEAQRVAIALNTLLDENTLKDMHQKGIVNFCVTDGHRSLNHDMDQVKTWASKALPVIDKMVQDKGRRFGVGNFGSVWMDLDNVVADGKAKKVRFYLAGVNNKGYQYNLGIDATFEAEW